MTKSAKLRQKARVEAGRWLATARADVACGHFATSGDFHAHACFHAQQAAEKAVKAVHFGRGARAVIGHNIRILIDDLDPREPHLDDLRDAARELDLFYVTTRDPSALTAGTPGEAFSATQSSRALELAEQIVETVAELLD